jgi:hypothetical protein
LLPTFETINEIVSSGLELLVMCSDDGRLLRGWADQWKDVSTINGYRSRICSLALYLRKGMTLKYSDKEPLGPILLYMIDRADVQRTVISTKKRRRRGSPMTFPLPQRLALHSSFVYRFTRTKKLGIPETIEILRVLGN